ncbi:hypothetical protein [Rhizomonospora bruguierae]|uniref:hypothetical protein n=1 Tax=Rhizomonospora bruguierae TaxID=1581705 RepID=UPI001BCE3EE8|nr:hypothetical protein [Micromonospora sp. NBRC 107566]
MTKPRPRTPWRASPRRLPATPWWLFAAAVAVPVADFALGRFLLGVPAPALQLLTAVGYPLYRRRVLRRARAAEDAASGPAESRNPGRPTLHRQHVHVEQDRRVDA